MNNVLTFADFLSVPLSTVAPAIQGSTAANPSPGDDADRVEGGPGLFRCILACSVVSLTFYSVAAWLIF